LDINICEKILEPFIKENDLIFYSVELTKEASELVLRVTLDKEDGIDLEMLAKANEYLSERLDKYDADMPEYLLEVTSPGAERVLRNDEEIEKYLGYYIHVEMNDNNIYEGTLEEHDNDSVTVRVNLKGRFKNFKLLKQNMKLIRLAVKI